ncbi:hypothetical protein CBS147346_10733 [Aspergillus niger]|nr:hypothetical protein CBS147346_10733 [Aspergillus niger]
MPALCFAGSFIPWFSTGPLGEMCLRITKSPAKWSHMVLDSWGAIERATVTGHDSTMMILSGLCLCNTVLWLLKGL